MLFVLLYDNLSKVSQGSGPDVTTQVLTFIIDLEQGLTYFAVKGVVQVAVSAAVDG